MVYYERGCELSELSEESGAMRFEGQNDLRKKVKGGGGRKVFKTVHRTFFAIEKARKSAS